jgi:membrane protein implicated in regulation of membrane protease activity
MLFLALSLAALLVVGILLAPLGAGIVAVTAVLVIAVVGWALWALFWRRSRNRVRYRLERPEFLGPGGPDDPDRSEPAGRFHAERTVEAGRR